MKQELRSIHGDVKEVLSQADRPGEIDNPETMAQMKQFIRIILLQLLRSPENLEETMNQANFEPKLKRLFLFINNSPEKRRRMREILENGDIPVELYEALKDEPQTEKENNSTTVIPLFG